MYGSHLFSSSKKCRDPIFIFFHLLFSANAPSSSFSIFWFIAMTHIHLFSSFDIWLCSIFIFQRYLFSDPALSEEQRRALTLVRPKKCPNRRWTLALAQPTNSPARQIKQPNKAHRTVCFAGKRHPTRKGAWRSPRRLPREQKRQFKGICYSPQELHEMKQLNR